MRSVSPDTERGGLNYQVITTVKGVKELSLLRLGKKNLEKKMINRSLKV